MVKGGFPSSNPVSALKGIETGKETKLGVNRDLVQTQCQP